MTKQCKDCLLARSHNPKYPICNFHQGYLQREQECSFDECNNKAEIFLNNNLNKGRIGFCKECFDLYNKHLEAREKLFRDDIRQEILSKVKEIENNNNYHKWDRFKKYLSQIEKGNHSQHLSRVDCKQGDDSIVSVPLDIKDNQSQQKGISTEQREVLSKTNEDKTPRPADIDSQHSSTNGKEHSIRTPVKSGNEDENSSADNNQKEHCKDCCCAKSWEALGIKKYDGKSIPEQITKLVSGRGRTNEKINELISIYNIALTCNGWTKNEGEIVRKFLIHLKNLKGEEEK